LINQQYVNKKEPPDKMGGSFLFYLIEPSADQLVCIAGVKNSKFFFLLLLRKKNIK